MLQFVPLLGIPIVAPGDDLAAFLGRAAEALLPVAGDVFVVTSKIVSKSEGRFVDLREVAPSARATELAAITRKDPRLVELILRESRRVSRAGPNVLITQHRLGFVSANAAIDHSNVGGDADRVLLMPVDPDASASGLRRALSERFACDLPVVIADSHGRPHRLGTVGVAVGASGLPGVEDWRGRPDLFGFRLQHTDIGLADMIASAATLVLGQAAEGVPAVLARGLSFSARDGNAAEICRPAQLDLYP